MAVTTLLLAGSTSLPAHGAPPTSTILDKAAYEVDPAALKMEFREHGKLKVVLPTLGEVTVVGHELDIWAEKKWYLARVSRDDILAEGVIDDIPIAGAVEGDPESVARPYLGLYGIYGRIVTRGLAFDFDPEARDGKFIQTVTMRHVEINVDDSWFRSILQPKDASTLGLTVSYVVYDVEQDYQTTHPDWYSRTSSAFANLYPMWTDVNLDLRLSGPWGWNHNWILTTDPSTALANYRNWLTSHFSGIANAYQTITARNLNGASTYGISYGDTARFGVSDNEWASSVVEMTNFCCDLYDANSAYERGIISGHEFSHVYGEEDEESGCNWWPTDCNIMQSGIDNSARRFYWRGDTMCEISARFYTGEEC